MITLKDLEKRNADFRKTQKGEAKEEAPAEQAQAEEKGRRPKKRRYLVVDEAQAEENESQPAEEDKADAE